MDIYEELVMVYLTRDPLVFVNPQYPMASGWSCPDFVALDYRQRALTVVEVSAAYAIGNLAKKVINRKTQWFDRILLELIGNCPSVIDNNWRIGVKVFIRKYAKPQFQRIVGIALDVEVITLEELGFPWGWNWAVDT